MPSGWASLGRFERGVLHEFCGVGGGTDGRDWTPPLALLVHLAAAALDGGDDGGDEDGARGWSALWIGSRLWPYPAVLTGHGFAIERDGCWIWTDGDTDRCVASGDAPGGTSHDGRARALLLERSLFVDPGPRALAWAADRALRCPSAAVVVVDGRGLDLGATRRLQLAAEASGTLALVARPASDARRSSVAANRFSVERVAPEGADSFDGRPAWRLVTLKRRTTHWALSDMLRGDRTDRTVGSSSPPSPVADGASDGALRDGATFADTALGDTALGDTTLDDTTLDDTAFDDAAFDDAVLGDAVLDDAVLDDAVLDDATASDAAVDDAGLDGTNGRAHSTTHRGTRP
ncbi:hypothetical protein [Planctomycetes bacterium Pla163]|uniref:hypothetical protein n=1 Tax=Rohdeia mirabilis TaxID=2528008 RepID=UPI0011A37868